MENTSTSPQPNSEHQKIFRVVRKGRAKFFKPTEGELMREPTETEIEGMMYASQMGGEYIDSIGITDMATYTEEQWMTLVECIITGFEDYLVKKTYENAAIKDSDIPY